MASAIVRSTLRTALRGGQRVNSVASKRSFSSGASVEEEARTIFIFLFKYNCNFHADCIFISSLRFNYCYT